jgi:signal transduction histidine kinase
MFRRLTILQKGLILITVPFFVQLVVFAAIRNSRLASAVTARSAVGSEDALTLSERIHARVFALDDAIHGHMLTGDQLFVRQYDDAARNIPGELDTLASLVADNPRQIKNVLVISASVQGFAKWAQRVRRMLEKGEHERAVAAIRGDDGKELLDDIDRDFRVFQTEELRASAARRIELSAARNEFDGLLGTGIFAWVLVTALIVLFTARGSRRRAASAQADALRIANSRALSSLGPSATEAFGNLDDLDEHPLPEEAEESNRRGFAYIRSLERRSKKLAEINLMLREKNRENEMFVYGASHDLRSPLVNLQGFSKELILLCQELHDVLDGADVPAQVRVRSRALVDKEMTESVHFIQSAVDRLGGIVDSLLRLARAGRVEYRREAVNVNEIVARIVESMRSTIDQQGAIVKVGSLPTVWGDRAAVEQIFANLIVNAVNYLDPARSGVVEVTGDTALDSGSTTVIFSVIDNGRGIPDNYRSKIFTAFQRQPGDKVRGEGVGLALVRRIVERLGGRIWFESVAAQGTTFFVALPAGPQNDQPDEPPLALDTELTPITPAEDRAWPRGR